MKLDEAIDIYCQAKGVSKDAVLRDDLYRHNDEDVKNVIEAIQNAGTIAKNLGSELRSKQIIATIIVLTEMLNK